jgi:hypothetical protein
MNYNYKKFLLLTFSVIIYSTQLKAQVRSNANLNNNGAANSSAFLDGSSSLSWNSSDKLGKGLVFPRTDLTKLTDLVMNLSVGLTNYPTRMDGMLVYNTGTGISAMGGAIAVTPGFYYYKNNSTTNLQGGTWTSLTGTTVGGRTIASAVNNADNTVTFNYTDGTSFTTNILTGPQGKSAFEVWQETHTGTLLDYQTAIKGEKGDKGADGGLAGDAKDDLVGVYPNLLVANLQGIPLRVKSPSEHQVLTYDGTKWVAEYLPAGTAGGTAGGDLSGDYPDPVISKIQGNSIIAPTPNEDEVLTYKNGNWVNAPVVAGGTVGGDLIGPLTAAKVIKIQNVPVSTIAPNTNEFLKYSGTRWIAAPLTLGGFPINITGTPGIGEVLTYNNGNWINAPVVAGGTVGGDLQGPLATAKLVKIQDQPLTVNPNTLGLDDYLLYDGAKWINSPIKLFGKPLVKDTLTNGTYLKYENGYWQAGAPMLPFYQWTASDLGGPFSTPRVTGIQNIPVNSFHPTLNQTLVYDGTEWKPTTITEKLQVTISGLAQMYAAGDQISRIFNIVASTDAAIVVTPVTPLGSNWAINYAHSTDGTHVEVLLIALKAGIYAINTTFNLRVIN